ncbi:tetratricopeptide repeat protein [Streptomyces bauhiniae]|uniref:tetratricopeptide repeat protein n=1 Tax=Streptomyces bauhiniae TaxID=2340725 RepID=UPI0037CDE921
MSDEMTASPSLRSALGAGRWTDFVPPRNPRFFGRSEYFAALDQGVLQTTSWITVLVGPSGVGKTHIAAEWVRSNYRRFDSVQWISSEIGQSARRQEEPEAGPARSTSRKPALVVIDGLRDWNEFDRFRPSHAVGHVLITSSAPAAEWSRWATVLPVDPWASQEAVEYLCKNVRLLSVDDAMQVVAELGGLPLALAYAEAWLRRGNSVDSFLNAVRNSPRVALGGSGPDHYPTSLLTRIQEARDALADKDRWHVRLLDAAALLGPAPLSIHSIGSRPVYRPDDDTLSTEIALYPDELVKAFPVLAKSGLSLLDNGLLHVSPVYCAVVRGLLSTEERRQAFRWADLLLKALHPHERVSDLRKARERWRPVLQSFLSHDPQEVVTREGLSVMVAAYRHLIDEGAWTSTQERIESLHRRGVALFTQDDPAVLIVAELLLRAYTVAQHFPDAVRLGRALVQRYASVQGPTEANTLRCASALITPLANCGQVAKARELARQTLREQAAQLGDQHRDTMLTKSRRFVVEGMVGRFQEAVAMGEVVLAEQQQVLGSGHPEVLATAFELARAYRDSGVHTKEAIDLFSETLQAQQQLLGDDHPDVARTTVALESVYFEAYGMFRNVDQSRLALARLMGEFGVVDRGVHRLNGFFLAMGISL